MIFKIKYLNLLNIKEFLYNNGLVNNNNRKQ